MSVVHRLNHQKWVNPKEVKAGDLVHVQGSTGGMRLVKSVDHKNLDRCVVGITYELLEFTVWPSTLDYVLCFTPLEPIPTQEEYYADLEEQCYDLDRYSYSAWLPEEIDRQLERLGAL